MKCVKDLFVIESDYICLFRKKNCSVFLTSFCIKSIDFVKVFDA